MLAKSTTLKPPLRGTRVRQSQSLAIPAYHTHTWSLSITVFTRPAVLSYDAEVPRLLCLLLGIVS